MQQLGLSRVYRESKDVEAVVRRIVAICTLPTEEMDFGIDLIAEYITEFPFEDRVKERLHQLVVYYRYRVAITLKVDAKQHIQEHLGG